MRWRRPGWIGAGLILLAYLLLSMGRLTGQSTLYQGDEYRRRGGLHHQRLVAWRAAVGGAQRDLDDDRSGGFMADIGKAGLVDLSHVIEDGMVTYKGLPGPHICDFWTREGSAANYDDGSSFQIGRIDMVANTGTYLDSPFHRYADGKDLAGLPLKSLADLPGIVVRRPHGKGIATDAADLRGARRARVRGAGSHRLGRALADRRIFWPITRSSPQMRPSGWSTKGRPSSASTATISTTCSPGPPGAHAVARGRNPDLRTYARAGPASRERFPILRRAAEGQRNGDVPGARLWGH